MPADAVQKDVPLTSGILKIAGWLAMTSSFITLPLVYISFKFEGKGDLYSAGVMTIIQISGIFLFVAIVLYLKKFLNGFYNFKDVDRNLELLIIADILAGVTSVMALYYPPVKDAAGYVVLVIIVAQGLVQVQFGYKLLKLPSDLGGMLKPFCYANMATGIFFVTILLIPFGILVSAVSDLMLGTIFLNMAKLVRNVELTKERQIKSPP